MLSRLNELVEAGSNFAFETTCAGLGHARFLKRCRSAGYRITLIFLWLPSVDLAISRVARRVADGGHRIPTDVVIRRYSAGIRNMRDIYLALADSAFVHDNSDGEGVLVVERREGTSLVVHDLARWKQIEDVR
jgi:predicted ABC-type ATPase